MRLLSCLLALLLALGTTNALAFSEELVTLHTRDGVEQRYLLLKPDTPRAAVILFAGGKGALHLSSGLFGPSIGWGSRNFLVRTRDRFADHGLMVAVVDAPSDRQGPDGMLYGFRSSAAHVTDIDAVIADLRRRADVPVWLIGTSRGTESAASVAIHSSQHPHGLVLTSSMSEPNRKGDAVTAMALGRIRMPTLIVAHQDDGCRWTPPGGARAIRAGLRNAPRVELRLFSGGDEQGRPCKAMSHHGFLGIESGVVDAIAGFVTAN